MTERPKGDARKPAEPAEPGGQVRFWCGESLRRALSDLDLDSVEGAFACRDGIDMTVPRLGHRTRMRLGVRCDDGRERTLFLKRYRREPFWWRVRRRLTYGRRRSPAGVEMDNIRAAVAAGLPTIIEAICGEQFDRWGASRSFIVVVAVPGEALEQSAEGFIARHVDDPDMLELFTARLAELVRRLHGAGYVHRDLYSSHVFLDETEDGFALHLIDLARMFAPRRRQFRWRVKDLAALKYSMPASWVGPCWQTFLRAYTPEADERVIGRWAKAVDDKVAYMSWRIGRRKRRLSRRGEAR
ncbi:MAG TPA: lipopolysaccharide kinase InaA family protein [Phycisphaerae bacterium]|nr:lipopolysaccharide kinase InaA family protein [Phycisphaerae bacterium]